MGATALGVLALLVACSGGPTEEPTPSPSGSVGAAIEPDDVQGVLLNDLQAETYLDMDSTTWQKLRQTATSLPWRMVHTGDLQHAVACTGQGAPTVVYIDGWDSPAAMSWSQAAVDQARSNRVCLFDRPGMGLSPARAGAAPHSTPEQHAQEMLDVLDTMGEPGPYLLVPWSYGGLVARSAATQYPERIAGMVLVDATSPLQPGIGEQWQGEDGIVDTDTIASSVGDGPDMGERPVIVLQAGRADEGTTDSQWAEWLELQKQAATISANSVHAIVDESDHAIPLRNPQAVVAATTAVSESIRSGNTPLDGCPEALAATGVSCPPG